MDSTQVRATGTDKIYTTMSKRKQREKSTSPNKLWRLLRPLSHGCRASGGLAVFQAGKYVPTGWGMRTWFPITRLDS